MMKTASMWENYSIDDFDDGFGVLEFA